MLMSMASESDVGPEDRQMSQLLAEEHQLAFALQILGEDIYDLIPADLKDRIKTATQV